MIADILPVHVLAEPDGHRSESASGNTRTKGEARESTESLESLTTDSRGGQKNLSGGVESRHAPVGRDSHCVETSLVSNDAKRNGFGEIEIPPETSSSPIAHRPKISDSGSSAPPAQKIKQDAAYYRSYRARNKGRIQKQEEKRRARDRNRKWVVQTTAGVPDVGWKVLSDFRVDVAMRAFWAKRKMAVPSATMGGILPSVSDFNEEVSILQMRTCI